MKDASKNPQQANNILVIGGTGKTGRRVVDQLKTRDINLRIRGMVIFVMTRSNWYGFLLNF